MLRAEKSQGYLPDELQGLHRPTRVQAERIFLFMKSRIEQMRKESRLINLILVSLGAIFILLTAFFISGHSNRTAFVFVALTVITSIASIKNMRESIDFRNAMRVVSENNYFVLEGYVREYEGVRADDSVVDLRFESKYGDLLRGEFTINGRGVTMDTELLMVYVPKENIGKTAKTLLIILTPYLMSEYGWQDKTYIQNIWYNDDPRV